MHRRTTRLSLLSLLTGERSTATALALEREWQGQLENLITRSRRLVAAADTLRRRPSSESVRECQLAWEAARLPWERVEGFLVGELREEEWAERIDGWPILPEEVEAQSRDYRAHRKDGATVQADPWPGPRGFHVLELLLYSVDGHQPALPDRIATALTADPDRPAFLGAVARELREDCEALRRAGLPHEREQAESSRLPGLLLERWAELLEEACFSKVLLPVQRGDPGLLESRWSGSTHRDVEANLEGMARAGRLLVPTVVRPDEGHLVERWEAGMEHCLRIARSLPEFPGTDLASALPTAESLFAAGHRLMELITADLLPRARAAV